MIFEKKVVTLQMQCTTMGIVHRKDNKKTNKYET